ncbi:hypothetical protein AB3N04_05915 [Alkalihalophilus sp. As8PL]|uniref:Uncharacterized protein n=1 Tax=Alkalihalophilus sp. As8PL TaxID=3237103 RepID=A0AB39BX16_9BACI
MVAIISILTIVGCSESDPILNDSQTETFSTQENALEDFADGVRGGIMLVNTTQGEQLLVANSTQRIYFISELLNKDGEYAVVKLSNDVSLNGVPGAGWQFSSAENNKYTVKLTNEKENNFIQIPGKQLFLSIEQGHNLSKTPASGGNAIESTEILK